MSSLVNSGLVRCACSYTVTFIMRFFQVLGVDTLAKEREIRRAFKKMSIQCHPDKDNDNKHANDNFIAIAAGHGDQDTVPRGCERHFS